MSVIKKMRKQTAVWWQRSAETNRFGEYTFAEPVEIECRWDDVAQEFLNAQNETQASRAIVYVDEAVGVAVGDRLKRGEMDSETPDDPMTIQDAHAVSRVDQNPNFRNTETLVSCFL